jgi:sugar diacid utilization regulator
MSSEQKNDLLVKRIKVFQIESNYSKDDIAKCLGVHPNTIRNKMHNPDTFTCWELKTLFKLMKLSDGDKASFL